MRILSAFLLLFVLGCKSDKPVDNTATRYTKSLQNNVEKAQAAADKANAAIAESQQNMEEMKKTWE